MTGRRGGAAVAVFGSDFFAAGFAEADRERFAAFACATAFAATFAAFATFDAFEFDFAIRL